MSISWVTSASVAAEAVSDEVVTSCVPLVRAPLPPEAAEVVAPMLRALGDPVRLRLLSLIASHEGGQACVCDLLPHFDLAQPTVSHHLKVLHQAGLVDRERRRSWVFYRVRPAVMGHLRHLFDPIPSHESDARA